MHKKRINIKKILISLGPLLFLLILLLLIELIVLRLNIKEYLFSPPSSVLAYIIQNFKSWVVHTSYTAFESIMGFLIANFLGFIGAIFFAHSRTIERALFPYAIMLKTTPIIAMAPMLILWFGSGIESKVAASALICFFPILVNATRGLRDVDRNIFDLFRIFGASKMQIFLKLRLLSSLPSLFSALKISSSLCVVGAIVGEFVGSDRGLGYVIQYSFYHLDTKSMFSAILASAMIGVSLFNIIRFIEKKFFNWSKPIEEI